MARTDDYARADRAAREAADRAIIEMKDVGTVGISYVLIAPGSSGFARWLRTHAGAYSVRSGLWRGTHLPVRTGQQAYGANHAWAKAYADEITKHELDVTAIPLTRAD